MYDKEKIIPGLVLFVVLFTFPLWYNVAKGNTTYSPDPVIQSQGECVEATEYMRSSHMDLLNRWRDAVVRGGARIYVASDGRKHTMSLSNTCMNCHADKSDFCDRCHDYIGVTPYCWDCHVEPMEKQ